MSRNGLVDRSAGANFDEAVRRGAVAVLRAADRVWEAGDGDILGLAGRMGLNPIETLAAATEAHRRAYRRRLLPKRRGVREILAPGSLLKPIQRQVLGWLSGKVTPHAAAHGFVRGRSHATHAQLHVGRSVVLTVDIRDFFGSVTADHLYPAVAAALPDMSLTEVRALVQLCTVERDAVVAGYTATALTRAERALDALVADRLPTFALWARGWSGAVDPKDLYARRWLAPVLVELGRPAVSISVVGRNLSAISHRWGPSARRLAAWWILSGRGPVPRSRSRLCDAAWTWVRPEGVEVATAREFEVATRADDSALRARLRIPRFHPRGVSSWRGVNGQGSPLATVEVESVRVLPQGAPTSPFLANIAARALDVELTVLADTHGLTYSRYADDLTFSGADLPEGFVGTVARRLEGHGFRLHRDKVCMRRSHRRQVVTGIVVNRVARPTTVDKRTLRALVASWAAQKELFILRDGGRVPLSEAQLGGHLAYWRMVDAPFVDRLLERHGKK